MLPEPIVRPSTRAARERRRRLPHRALARARSSRRARRSGSSSARRARHRASDLGRPGRVRGAWRESAGGARARARSWSRARPEQLILRVDRTDPSKNVVRGLEAFGLLLDRRPDLRGRVGMLALLDPSRQEIPEYVEDRDAIEAAAAARRGAASRARSSSGSPTTSRESVAAYKQFDVLLVNAVMDGLNLVAKEAPLVNTRDGVVVLSVNAGAFEELGEWVVPVDPLDVDGQADALERALELPRRRAARAARGDPRATSATHDLAALDRRAARRPRPREYDAAA